MTGEQGRRMHLDGLRGVAVLCVLAEHFSGEPARYFDFGYYGVDLFFVLSGFLITGILLRQKSQGLMQGLVVFTGRRAFRIFPLYYLVLAIMFSFDLMGARAFALPLSTYSWNYFCHDGGPFYLWSLSVEEQFYVFWPFVVLLMRARPLVLAACTLIFCVASYWQILFHTVSWLNVYNYTGLPNRMGSLCLGAAGALLHAYHPDWWRGLKHPICEVFALVAIIVSMMSLRQAGGMPYFSAALVVQGLCSLLLVLICWDGAPSFGPLERLLGSSLMRRLGVVSYGVYLIHLPLGEWFRSTVFGPLWHSIPFDSIAGLGWVRWHSWIFSFPLCSFLCYGVALLSWRFVEKPLLDRRDRLFPS